jgi:phosphohistidine phosphatase
MKTVYILRHGKAEDSNPHGDKARNISDKGRQDLQSLLPMLESLPIPADIVLCSTADRTRQTLDILERCHLLEESELYYEDKMYNAHAETLLELLHGLPEDFNSVLFIGHNPGLQEFAMALLGTGDDIDVANLSQTLPTSGFVSLCFGEQTWPDIAVSSGHLELFRAPVPASQVGGSSSLAS